MTLILDNVETGQSLTKLNDNFSKIEQYVNDELSSRTETRPQEADMDMNGNRLLNLPAPRSLHEPLRVIDGIDGISVEVQPTWGGIQGELDDQTDLMLVIDAKQSRLVSGVNIKSINGESLLGSGNLIVGSGGTQLAIPQDHIPYRNEVGEGSPNTSVRLSVFPDPFTVVFRSTTGNIHCAAPLEDGQAATKKYVDDKVAAGGGGTGWTPPTLPPSTVLIRSASGWGLPDGYLAYADNGAGGTLAQRTSTGHLVSGAPTAGTHLANKQYVDSMTQAGAKARIHATVFAGAPSNINSNCPFDRSTLALNASLNTSTGVITVQRTGHCIVTGRITTISRRSNAPQIVPTNPENPDNVTSYSADVYIGSQVFRVFFFSGERMSREFSFQAPVNAGDTIRISTTTGLFGDWAGSQYVNTLCPHIEVAVL